MVWGPEVYDEKLSFFFISALGALGRILRKSDMALWLKVNKDFT
jgi:hypothetical protein